jgi:AcrR family transcriptional regulator
MTAIPNVERSERTRTTLIQAARTAFATDGYGPTSTPRIAEEAKVSRGALYHHFASKADLFRAVVEYEQATVAAEILSATTPLTNPIDALTAGTGAFLNAMRDPGRRRILLVDGPAILGAATMREIDQQHAGNTLAQGIAEAIERGYLRPLPPAALADLLSAVFDRIAQVDDPNGDYRAVLEGLLDGITIRRD